MTLVLSETVRVAIFKLDDVAPRLGATLLTFAVNVVLATAPNASMATNSTNLERSSTPLNVHAKVPLAFHWRDPSVAVTPWRLSLKSRTRPVTDSTLPSFPVTGFAST